MEYFGCGREGQYKTLGAALKHLHWQASSSCAAWLTHLRVAAIRLPAEDMKNGALLFPKPCSCHRDVHAAG